MDIHKPKAAHSWREFAIEIGTIICGILIALGLEQVIEAVHWSEKVRAANEQINSELGGVYFGAKERVMVQPCLDRRLAQVSERLLSSTGPWEPLPPIQNPEIGDFVYRAPVRPWSDQAWRAYMSDGTVQHMPARLRAVYNPIYTQVLLLGESNQREFEQGAGLNLLNHALTLTTPERNALELRVEELRVRSRLEALRSNQLLSGIARGKRVDDKLAEQSVVKGSNSYQMCVRLGLLQPLPSPLVLSPPPVQAMARLVRDRD